MSQKFTATEMVIGGRKTWVVDLGIELLGKRHRIKRTTKEKAEATAEQYVTEKRLHGAELAGLTTTERAFILRLRERGITVEEASRRKRRV